MYLLIVKNTTTQQNNVPYLDVSATTKNGELMICVVNRHKDEAITTDILSQNGAFGGSFTVQEVTGPDVKATNDFNRETVKAVTKPSVKANGTKFTYTFPPHSFTLLRGKVEK
jgi:alpha-N-arabinofuranosidase